MNYARSSIDQNIADNKVEFEENKILLWLSNFWQFSLFYGDYIASLHAKKRTIKH